MNRPILYKKASRAFPLPSRPVPSRLPHAVHTPPRHGIAIQVPIMPSTMQAANRLQSALADGSSPAMGCWQMIPGSNVSRTLARTGVDWVLVDCEHGNMDGESGAPHCFAPYGEQPHLPPGRGFAFFSHLTVE
jgi:hypothetical protein